jgi:hypothetical protein
MLINVNECKGRNLKGRERFVGVVLMPGEARLALGGIEDGLSGVAANIAFKMPRLRRSRRKPR